MLLNLTDMSDEPLQSQIVRQIRAKILNGELPPDSSLPSIRKLAKDGRVSVITVQRAYEHLMQEELIHSRRGKGFFVSSISFHKKRSMAESRLHSSLERPLRTALSEGLSKAEIIELVKRILKTS